MRTCILAPLRIFQLCILGLLICTFVFFFFAKPFLNFKLNEALETIENAEVSAIVDHVNPKQFGLSDISYRDESWKVFINSIKVDYSPLSLFHRRVNRLKVAGVSARYCFDSEKIDLGASKSNENKIQNLLMWIPPFDALVIEDTEISLQSEKTVDELVAFVSGIAYYDELNGLLGDFRIISNDNSLVGSSELELSPDEVSLQFDLILNEGKLTDEIDHLLSVSIEKNPYLDFIDYGEISVSGLFELLDESSLALSLFGQVGELELGLNKIEEPLHISNLLFQFKKVESSPVLNFGFKVGSYELMELALSPVAIKGVFENSVLALFSEKLILEYAGYELPVSFSGAYDLSKSSENGAKHRLEVSTGFIELNNVIVEPFGIELIALNEDKTVFKFTPISIINHSTLWLEDTEVNLRGQRNLSFNGKLYDDLGALLFEMHGDYNHLSKLGGFTFEDELGTEQVSLEMGLDETVLAVRLKGEKIISLSRWLGVNKIKTIDGTLFGKLTVNASGTHSMSPFNVWMNEAEVVLTESETELKGFNFKFEGKLREEEILSGNFNLEVEEIPVGEIFLNQIKLEGELNDRSKFVLSSAEMRLLDGSVTSDPFNSSFTNPAFETRIHFQEIKTDRLMGLLKEDRFMLISKIDGFLDISYQSKGIVISGGNWNLSENTEAFLYLLDASLLKGFVSEKTDDPLGIKFEIQNALKSGMKLDDLQISLSKLNEQTLNFKLVFSGLVENEGIRIPLKNFTVNNQVNISDLEKILSENFGIKVFFH